MKEDEKKGAWRDRKRKKIFPLFIYFLSMFFPSVSTSIIVLFQHFLVLNSNGSKTT